MKVYVRGSKSKTKNDYVVVIKDDNITWYYPDLAPSTGTLSSQAGRTEEWIRN